MKRLESLDVLRGLNIFCLVVVDLYVHRLNRGNSLRSFILTSFSHKGWEGLSLLDLIMPLFLFISGVTIPYSLEKYRSLEHSHKSLGIQLCRRFIFLWILGMICNGNLLALDSQHIYLYSHALQAIAVGYLFCSLFFLYIQRKYQIVIALCLLLFYWAAMEFCSIEYYGNGNYSEQRNLAEGIDTIVLGRFRNNAQIIDGKVIVDPTYTYTWILSSLNFIVTVFTGMFAGQILRSRYSQSKKLSMLIIGGAIMIIVGMIMSLVHPIIKRIWTSSMVLVSSGFCFLFLSVFYYYIDCCGYKQYTTMLKVYGMNSLTAYILSEVVNFTSITDSLLYGLKQFVGIYYPLVTITGNVLILYLILYVMYRNKYFIRV